MYEVLLQYNRLYTSYLWLYTINFCDMYFRDYCVQFHIISLYIIPIACIHRSRRVIFSAVGDSIQYNIITEYCLITVTVSLYRAVFLFSVEKRKMDSCLRNIYMYIETTEQTQERYVGVTLRDTIRYDAV